MTTAEIQRTQDRIGVEPDGFWGPLSTAAAKAHLRGLMPATSPFPTQADVAKYYGPHGVKDGFTPPRTAITLPFPIYYESAPIVTLRPHALCAVSLLAVFNRLADAFPDESSRRKAGILTYDGLYNPRPMRGGSSWSMHSWAIAIDLNAEHNGNTEHWPARAVMPIEVMECFAAEGWLSAGAFWSRDAMHFQATK